MKGCVSVAPSHRLLNLCLLLKKRKSCRTWHHAYSSG